MMHYPIKFNPILKEKMWGGHKLTSLLHKSSSEQNIGESWEISSVEGDVSVVSNGELKGKTLKYLIQKYKEAFVGKQNYEVFGDQFPLLIKFIDASKDLSVQVHPNDTLAQKRHKSNGKTEMWYIMQADKNARLILGFDKKINENKYRDLLEQKKIMTVLNEIPVKKGDSFFINTGTVHAIGAGILLAEIQQTSDITYRIYDFDRVDNLGNKRELHTDLAVGAIDFAVKKNYKLPYSNIVNTLNEIVVCDYFKTNLIPIKGKIILDYSAKDSFVIFICVEGKSVISIDNFVETLNVGETVLIPAEARSLSIEGYGKLLETTV